MPSKLKVEDAVSEKNVPTEPPEAEIPTEAPGDDDIPFEEPAPEGDEPDEGDEEADDGDEPEAPEVEPVPTAAQQSEAATMKAFDSAQRRAGNYVKAVVDVLGEAAQDLHPCPRCADFLPGFIVSHVIRPVTPEQRVAVKVSMGEDAEPAYVQHQDSRACPSCDGWGKVLTGSHVQNQGLAQCPTCSGKGFVGSLADRPAPPAPLPLPDVVSENGDEAAPGPDTDPWGRTRADALYGVMPGYERD